MPPFEVHQWVNEMVQRQAKARQDMIEGVLLEALATGSCGVLVVDDPRTGDVTAMVDMRVPYATVAYFPRGMDDPSGLFSVEPAPVETLHALLQHLARKLLER